MAETTIDETPRAPRGRSRPTLRILCVAGEVVDRPDVPLSLRGPLVVGREPSCDVVLDDPRVSRKHAVLHASRDRVTIEDHSKTGTYVADTPVREHALEDGQVVVVGRSAFVVHPSGNEPAASIAGLRGESPAMRRLARALDHVGASDLGLLLTGETGVGKDAVARAVHAISGRAGRYVAVNCSALPANLVEAQLFGHVAGAFTGADRSAPGFFRAADGGTLFLDEIGELPLETQPKLLRALENREVTPVGETRATPFDARVIAATHHDLVADVAEGQFRADLYARLSDFVLTLPPLRDRAEDVLPLLAELYDGALPPLSAGLLRALLAHPWPFNVREVAKLAARLALEGPVERLELEVVEDELARNRELAARLHGDGGSSAPGAGTGVPSRDELDALLRQHGGKVSDVARAIGRSRKQVYRWLSKHDLQIEDYRDAP